MMDVLVMRFITSRTLLNSASANPTLSAYAKSFRLTSTRIKAIDPDLI